MQEVFYFVLKEVRCRVKKAIVVVSFGTVNDEVRRNCIESVENKIKASFPAYEVRRAFTSNFIIKKLSARGIYVDTLPQALEKIKQEGYPEVIVQSTHLTPGEEYENKIVQVVQSYKEQFEKISVGRPVFMSEEYNGKTDDFLLGIQAVRHQIPKHHFSTEIVFMGHGSPNQHNAVYEILQRRLDEMDAHITIGVLEENDYPNIEHILIRLKEKKWIKRVILMPFLLVAGNHVEVDMAGAHAQSWRSRLIKSGYEVQVYLHGLGENEAFQELYVAHIKDAIKK